METNMETSNEQEFNDVQEIWKEAITSNLKLVSNLVSTLYEDDDIRNIVLILNEMASALATRHAKEVTRLMRDFDLTENTALEIVMAPVRSFNQTANQLQNQLKGRNS